MRFAIRLPPVCCLLERFPGHNARRRNPGGAWRPFWAEEMDLGAQKGQMAGLYRAESQRRESYTEEELGGCALGSLQGGSWVLMWESYPRWGKNQLEELEWTIQEADTRPGIAPAPNSQSGTPHNSWNLRRHVQQGFASKTGQNYHLAKHFSASREQSLKARLEEICFQVI